MAANQVGQVEIRIVPDGSQFGPQLQAILDAAAGKASAAGQAIGQNIGQKVGPQVQEVGRSMSDVNLQFDTAARKALAFTGAVMGTKAVIEGVVNKLAGLFDQLAQAQAGFQAIAGADKGNKLLEDIRQFAKESPFVTQQLVNYSQQLLGVGMAADKIVPLLRDTGNVIASVGGDTNNLGRVLFAMTQIQTVGRLTGQDAMQLQSSLIPITKMLSSYLGKSTQEVKKLQEQGRITADQVFGAISAAGAKVPEAMDNAVRNIAGARSVLSDTITILMQDAPALKDIYQDLVVGIQSFAKVLDSDEVRGAILNAFAAVGKAYEALKPIVTGFLEASGEGSLSTLKIFTGLLETLSDVVSAIPKPALEALGKILAAIAVLKAPMMLIKYVEQFQKMAQIFMNNNITMLMKKRVTAMAEQEVAAKKLTAANQKLAASTNAVNSAMSKPTGMGVSLVPSGVLEEVEAANGMSGSSRFQGLNQSFGNVFGSAGADLTRRQKVSKFVNSEGFSTASSIALMVGAQAVDSAAGENSVAGQTISGAMQGAAMGMMVAGPWGAAAGAGIGGMMSYFQAQKAAAEKHKKDMEELGLKTAQGYIDSLDAKFGEDLSVSKIEGFQTQIDLTNQKLQERANEYANGVSRTSIWKDIAKKIILHDNDLTPQVVKDYDKDSVANQLKGEITGYEQEIEDATRDLMDRVNTSLDLMPIEVQRKIAESGAAVQVLGGIFGEEEFDIRNIQQANELALRYGMTLQQIVDISSTEEFTRLMTIWEDLSDDEQKAATSAATVVTAYEKGTQAAKARYENFSKVIGFELKTMGELKSATESVTKAYLNKEDKTAQLSAQQAVLNAQMATYAYEYARAYDAAKNRMDAPQAEIVADAIALKKAEQTVKELQVVSVKSISEMAKAYSYSSDKLREVLGLQASIDKDMKITVTVAIDEALKQLLAVTEAAESMWSVVRGTAVSDPRYKAFTAEARDLDMQAKSQKNYIQSLIDRQTNPEKKGGGGESFADKVKSAAAALENAIKSAMSAVENAANAWKATIKQRVQYEEAVGVGRAIRNAQRQATDITFLQKGINQLKARGLSEEALTALDINALTDVRQVKRLLSASPEEIKRLSSTVANRDKLASTLASDRQREENRKTITQAILEAARILGYKFTEAQAKTIAAEFNITTDTDAKKMIEDILKALSGGKITSVPST